MVFVPAANVFECVAKGVTNGQPWNNVWHIRHGENQVAPDPATVAEWFGTRWHDAFIPGMSSSAQLTEVTVRALDEQFSLAAVRVYSPAISGHITGDCMPANVALLVQKLTGKVGRQNRGRSYIPAVPENFTTSGLGNIGATQLAAAQARADAFRQAMLSDILATSMAPVVVSRYQAGAPRPQAIVTEISNLVVSGYVATQRDRLKRGA